MGGIEHLGSILQDPRFEAINISDYTFDQYELWYNKSNESVNLGLFLNGKILMLWM